MTAIPRPLKFEVLIGCTWVAARPEHVKRGDIFRMLRKNGSVYLAAARVLDCDDAGVYTAAADGGKDGVPFEVVQAVTVLVAPTVDLGE